jgi:uncharacterized spore protein YtfJ
MTMNEKLAPIVEPIEQMLSRLHVDTVFGKPTTEGNVTVVPVAEIGIGFGYGYGFGQAPHEATTAGQETARPAEGGGGGGGAGGRARPRGYIKISPDGVEFEPFPDETRIALAGIAMGAWSVFWIALTIRAFVKARGK